MRLGYDWTRPSVAQDDRFDVWRTVQICRVKMQLGAIVGTESHIAYVNLAATYHASTQPAAYETFAS